MPTSDTRTREAYRRLVRHELMQPTDDRQLNDPVPAVSRSAVPPDFGKGSALLRTPSLAVAPVALPQRHRLAQLLESRSLPALPQHRSRPTRPTRPADAAHHASEPEPATEPPDSPTATAAHDAADERPRSPDVDEPARPLHFMPIDGFDDGGGAAGESSRLRPWLPAAARTPTGQHWPM